MQQANYPKEVVLKDGSEIVLRLLSADDTDALVDFYNGLEQGLLRFMREEPCRPELIQKWLSYQEAGVFFSVVAEWKGRIVGHITLRKWPHGGRKHVGKLRFYVADDFRNKQLGTWMVFDMIKHAMGIGLEMLHADLISGLDDPAIDALKKLDFHSEGRLRDYLKDNEGRCHDVEIMIKQLHKAWSDF